MMDDNRYFNLNKLQINKEEKREYKISLSIFQTVQNILKVTPKPGSGVESRSAHLFSACMTWHG